MGCALYAGDDVTDLDAFRGLRELVAAGDLGSALCVGVRSDETPEALEEAADVLVDGPIGVRGLLTTLASSV
jgi:trehalose 6-phosphate phosphatase